MAIPPEAFVLTPNSDATLQHQLRARVIDGILAGRFVPGARMPSSRKLAAHLGLSRITVTLAYTDLVASEYLISKGRSGYFVSENAPRPAIHAPRRASKPESRVDWARILGAKVPPVAQLSRPSDWRRYKYPFIYGQTDPRLFDHANWRRCALQALGARDFASLTEDSYGRDDPHLVEQIVTRILPRRGIAAAPSEVIVTMGAQNALWLLSQTLLTQRRLAVMEEPCYPALREILGLARCSTLGLQVDAEGLPPEAVPPETDVLFVTPSHHCPTAVTMPITRRRDLLARAEADDFLIVEDDYEFELAFMRTPSPALKSLDQNGRVAYVGSFAKSLFPGLRLGYIVAPEPLVQELRALRGMILRHPPGHVQRATAYFLAQGHYDAQVARMTRAYQQRHNAALAAMEDHGLVPERPNTFGGSSFWMRMPGGGPAEPLAERLRDRDVLIEPADAFCEGPGPGPFYRIAYSSIAAGDIPEGIRRIAEAVHQLTPQTGLKPPS